METTIYVLGAIACFAVILTAGAVGLALIHREVSRIPTATKGEKS